MAVVIKDSVECIQHFLIGHGLEIDTGTCHQFCEAGNLGTMYHTYAIWSVIVEIDEMKAGLVAINAFIAHQAEQVLDELGGIKATIVEMRAIRTVLHVRDILMYAGQPVPQPVCGKIFGLKYVG